MIDRITNTDSDEEDKVLEDTLRPRYFTSYIGQARLKQNLKLSH